MSQNLLELQRKRATLIANARELVDKAEQEKRAFTQEDTNAWDAHMKAADGLKADIDREQRMTEAEASLGRNAFEAILPDPAAKPGSAQPQTFVSRSLRTTHDTEAEWRNEPEWKAILGASSPDLRKKYQRYLRTGARSPELRALQLDSDAAGGYLQAPLQMVDALIKAIDDQVYIRQWATVIAVPNAASLGAPSLDADPEDADWTTEIGTVDADTQMVFGRRELSPKPANKLLKVARAMLSKVPSVESLVTARLAYKHAITWEKAGLTGTGAGQPLGVFTASALGISTSRDVSTDNTTTAVTLDGLINAKYALNGGYWRNAKWLGHRDFFKMVAKLKDGSGQYLWQPSVQADQPDRLLNVPAFMSEYAPNTFTTGLYVGIIGDFSHYWIADSMAFGIQRLDELYAANRQVGFISEMEGDGMPVLEGAFARVKLG